MEDHRFTCSRHWFHSHPQKLLHRHHAHASFSAKDVNSHIPFVPGEGQVNARLPHAQSSNMHLGQELGQVRVGEDNLFLRATDFETQASLKEKEHGPRGPRLRGARNWIERRAFAWTPVKTAEQLRKPVQVEEKACVEQSRENLNHFVLKSVSGKPCSDDGIIMRPDRSVVIGHWVVARFASSYSTHSPPGERCFAGECRRHTARPILTDDPREETMTCI